MKKYVPILIIVLICGSVLGLLWFCDHKMKIENVEVIGGTKYTKAEIEDFVIKDDLDKISYLLYLRKQVFGNVGKIPFVEKIDIEVTDMNSVVLYVYDKAITGCVKHMGKYMHFDRDGIVVESSADRMPGVPEITGITFSKVVLNEALSVEDQTIFKKLMNLTLQFKKEEISCNRIDFDLRNNITIYFDGNQALLGAGEIHDEQIACLKKLIMASGEQKYIYDLQNYNPAKGEVTGKPIIEDENEYNQE